MSDFIPHIYIDQSVGKALTLRNTVVIDGNERINKMYLKERQDGVIIKVVNGKNKSTGKSRDCNILLDKNNLKILKEWLDELELNV